MRMFALLPALGVAMEPVLAQVDRLLEHDTLFQRVKADPLRRRPTRPHAGGLPHPWR
jgi:hypothetical protein